MQGDLNTWHKRLKAKHEACELTSEEASLLCLLDIRNNLIHHSKALNELIDSQGVVEGVMTSFDQVLAMNIGPVYPGYHRAGLATGRPVARENDVAGALSEGGQ
jgi:hypothetical protein